MTIFIVSPSRYVKTVACYYNISNKMSQKHKHIFV